MSAAGGRLLVDASLEEDAAGEGRDGRRHWGEGEYPPHGRSHRYEMQVVHPASCGVYMSTRAGTVPTARMIMWPPIGSTVMVPLPSQRVLGYGARTEGAVPDALGQF